MSSIHLSVYRLVSRIQLLSRRIVFDYRILPGSACSVLYMSPELQWGLTSCLQQCTMHRQDVQDDSDTQESKSIIPNDGPEPPDPTEVHSKAVSAGTDVQGDSDTQESESILPDDGPEPPDPTEVHTEAVSTRTGVNSSSGNTAVTAVTIKTEPQDPMEADAPAISPGAGLGMAAPKEFQQDPVPTNPIGSNAVEARPLQWVPTSACDEAQPQANVVYLHSVKRHGIAIQPVVVAPPVVAVRPERPDVAPP
ncbi:hypothetical protein HPB47_012871 [Ixodes persulcatus]|uniref:Uncharacterized protein n=1 Tax=Ixodes persulcatus TaxID=34615 RepID=A0AC60NSC3_IXOPE|nr:hypothetical protein HPB47_012871 [Ixodes persulcatus]